LKSRRMAKTFVSLLVAVGVAVVWGFVQPPQGAPLSSSAQRRRPQQRLGATTPEIGSLLEQPCSFTTATTKTETATVAELVEELARRTAQVRGTAASVLPTGAGEASSEGAKTWLLRFVAGLPEKATLDLGALEKAVASSIAWRLGDGRHIADAAREAHALAIKDGGWKNEPVLAAAPSSAKIAPYFGDSKLLTLRNGAGDGLIYAIRAGQIDDAALMADVSSSDLSDFFLYAKAVNERVAHDLASKTGKLAAVVTCNDLSGVDLFGDTSFRDALSKASKKGDEIFPGLAAETILLNLPALLRALVNVFKPLFPPSVQKKIKFSQFDLDGGLDRNSPIRKAFLDHVDKVIA